MITCEVVNEGHEEERSSSIRVPGLTRLPGLFVVSTKSS